MLPSPQQELARASYLAIYTLASLLLIEVHNIFQEQVELGQILSWSGCKGLRTPNQEQTHNQEDTLHLHVCKCTRLSEFII